MHTKRTIRKRVAERLGTVSPAQAAAAAAGVIGVLLTLPEIVSAHVVTLYCAMAGEIDLTEMCETLNRQGKETLLPRYNEAAEAYEMAKVESLLQDTKVGHYGIREPRRDCPASRPEKLNGRDTVWCVPGLAFDASGNRLGRGGGYYDRLLKNASGAKIGIAYDFQVLDAVPTTRHDVAMDLVVTERRCLRCRPAAA